MTRRAAVGVDSDVGDLKVVSRQPVPVVGLRARIALEALHTYPDRMLPIVARALRHLGIALSSRPVSVFRPCDGERFEVTAASAHHFSGVAPVRHPVVHALGPPMPRPSSRLARQRVAASTGPCTDR